MRNSTDASVVSERPAPVSADPPQGRSAEPIPASPPGVSPTSAPPPSGKGSDLKLRVISGVLLAPVVLAAVWYGDWVFRAALALVAVLAVREWLAMVPNSRRPLTMLLALAGVLGAFAVQIGSPLESDVWLACGVAIAGAVATSLAGGGRDRWLLGAGVIYIAAGIVGLEWLRAAPDVGLSLFLFAMLAVWATDIGAYAAGRSIGGPKLAPRISPKKTWAGLVGGVIASGLVGWLVALWAVAAEPLLAMFVGAVTAVVSQAGDLFESAIKRRYDVKDSGSVIPGHGGILDRIDGLLVAAPLLALFHATLGFTVSWW